MKKNQITLPSDLYAALQKEAEHLALDINMLVAGLVKNFLNKKPGFVMKPALYKKPDEDNAPAPAETETETTLLNEQRRHERRKVDTQAMLVFKAENGLSARYNSAGLKDVAPGGVLLEYSKTSPTHNEIAPGKQLELIIQLYDNEPPLHMQCEICRVAKDKEKTSLGVAFVGLNKNLSTEAIKILSGRAK
jgi:hypothetical protein